MFHLELLQLALNIHISSEICTFGSIIFEFHLVRSNGLRIGASFGIVAVGLHPGADYACRTKNSCK